MNDTPKGFFGELRSATLKKRVGQIALAVVLAESCIRFLNSLVWFLVLPIISSLMKGHIESVLFETKPTFPFERLFAAILEFGAAIIFVFYVNRGFMERALDQLCPESRKGELATRILRSTTTSQVTS